MNTDESGSTITQRVVRKAHCRLARLVLGFTLLLAPWANAETQLYVSDVCPFWYQEGSAEKGVAYELLREMSARVGTTGRIQPLPLKRELGLMKLKSNVLGTIIREPGQDGAYSWIVKLLDDRVVLITRADSHVDISTLAAARNLRVGVLLGGPSELAANRLGFTHIEAVSNTRSNAYKLALGRLDALVVVMGVASSMQTESEKELSPMRVGATLEPISIYLAGSVDFDAEQARKLRIAFDAMRKDGSYERILRKYHYVPPKS